MVLDWWVLLLIESFFFIKLFDYYLYNLSVFFSVLSSIFCVESFYFIFYANFISRTLFYSFIFSNLAFNSSISFSSFLWASFNEFSATSLLNFNYFKFFYVGSTFYAWYWLLIIYLTVMILFLTLGYFYLFFDNEIYSLRFYFLLSLCS